MTKEKAEEIETFLSQFPPDEYSTRGPTAVTHLREAMAEVAQLEKDLVRTVRDKATLELQMQEKDAEVRRLRAVAAAARELEWDLRKVGPELHDKLMEMQCLAALDGEKGEGK